MIFNMAKMAKGGFLCAGMEETQYRIKKPRADVREEKKLGVMFPRHNKGKAAMERHQAMLRQNHMARCLPWHTGPVNNPHTHSRCKGTGVHPPNQQTQPTREQTPPMPVIAPTANGNTSRAQCHQTINVLSEHAYSHTSLSGAQFYTLDVSG
jgi:hypothetical protein